MPTTRTPRSASGSAIRPVPIANSSAAAVAGQLREHVHGGRDHVRVEHAARVLVVARGDALAEVALRAVPVSSHDPAV